MAMEDAHKLEAAEVTRLAETWQPPSGIIGWLSATDHKTIGLRFIVTAFVFFLLGGVLALIMRLQLALPLADVVDPELYNQIFTMHGTTMMFFFAVPMLEGVAIYLLPLILGARETATPRLNTFSYFVYLLAGIALYFGFLIGRAPNAGWFSYTPLSLRLFSPSDGIDLWALSISLLEISALAQAITVIVTILKLRAPGMTLARMPVFAWAYLVMSCLVVVAMPALITASMMLETDRTLNTHFFNAAQGGDPLLWQHLFWWFGHPDVYIIFIPAFGFISSILVTFTRRQLVGHAAVVLALIAIGLISVTVWAHHMFTVGLPLLALGFFAGMTMFVAVPSGVQIFAWLATTWSSERLWISTPFLFSIGFVIIFVFGGLSGVSLAAVPFDWQVHDTFYVVAHFHYVLIGGMVFPLLAAFYYWFPKVTGRMMSETAGKWNFWLAFIGFNVAFLPMHLAGFWGMPRRVYTYHPGLGLEWPNLISTIGAFLFAGSIVMLVVNALWALRNGRPAGDNPWGAGTLEWATASPPPDYNFRIVPSVRSLSPLWSQPEFAASVRGATGPDHPDERLYVELREDREETVGTEVLLARPESRIVMEGPSPAPFLAAVATAFTFISFMFQPWLPLVGAVLVTATLLMWHWPSQPGGPDKVVPVRSAVPQNARYLRLEDLPASVTGPRDVTWWSMAIFIFIELLMFGLLVFAYFYLATREAQWPPGDLEPPKLTIPIIYTVALLLSSAALWWGEQGIKQDRNGQLVLGLTAGIGLALVYLVLKGVELGLVSEYRWDDHAYGSISWAISIFHASHVLAAVIKAGAMLPFTWRGHFHSERRLGIELAGMYWHFVVLVWIPLFATLYLAPRLL